MELRPAARGKKGEIGSNECEREFHRETKKVIIGNGSVNGKV
jgi:hypothetical protein